MRLFQIAMITALGLTILQANAVNAGPTPAKVWRTDFSQSLAEAKRLNRPLLLHFGATWCPPCKRMERETLNSPELLKILEAGFVAAKLDVDDQPEAQSRYDVKSLPTDILLSPDGKVLSRTEGYQPKNTYLAAVGRIDARYTDSRRLVAQAQAPAAPAAKTPISETPSAKEPDAESPVAQKPVLQMPVAQTPAVKAPAGEKLPPLPIDLPVVAAAEPQAAPVPNPEKNVASLALDGYCPVTLRMTRTWKQGKKDFSLEHQGQVFYFTSQKQVQEFKANPNHFAPRLLGCDPVILNESNLAVLGSTKYGAFYEGELFLFETAESRSRFRSNPGTYSRTKHVLNPSDIKKRRA